MHIMTDHTDLISRFRYPTPSTLRLGLLGEKHRDRYLTSASFHYAVDTLAAMLPSWVDGLATQSDAADAEMAAAVEALRTTPGPPFFNRAEANDD